MTTGRAPEASGRFAWAATLVALTLAAYLPIFRGGFIWDDDSYVTRNETLQSFDGLVEIWSNPKASPQYYPLVFTTFWIENQIWGLKAPGYHIVNVVLHAVSAVLLWRLLVGLAVPGAWIAAAIFAVHPVHVESVAWIAERKNVLSGVFYFLALAAYLRFRPLTSDPKRGSRFGYPAAFFLFVAALLSKTVTCSLPAAILLLIWWRRGRIRVFDVLPLIPMFFVGLAFAALTTHLERTHVGAEKIDWQLFIPERCVIAGRALWFYLAKLIAPVNLSFVYPRWLPDSGNGLHLAAPIAWLLMLGLLLAFQRRMGRGPAAAMFYFSGTLLPALGFIDVFPFKYSFVADHFQYLASIGPIVLVAAALTRFSRTGIDSNQVRPSPLRPVLATAVVLLFAGLTLSRSIVFQSEEAVWRDTLAKNDAAWSAHQNLGVLLEERGETEEAVAHFRRAIELAPGEFGPHVSFAIALDQLGRPDEALAAFDRALALNPESWTAHYNLAGTLARLGRELEALNHLEDAAHLAPEPSPAHFNRGVLLEKLDRPREALAAYREAVRARPSWIKPRLAAARCHARLGENTDALKLVRDALRVSPNDQGALQLLRQLEGQ